MGVGEIFSVIPLWCMTETISPYPLRVYDRDISFPISPIILLDITRQTAPIIVVQIYITIPYHISLQTMSL